MGRECSTNGEKRPAYRIWVKNSEEKGDYEGLDVGEWIMLNGS
jgi:hypothetical protein